MKQFRLKLLFLIPVGSPLDSPCDILDLLMYGLAYFLWGWPPQCQSLAPNGIQGCKPDRCPPRLQPASLHGPPKGLQHVCRVDTAGA
eukprot:1819170-Amphidinium_carterae.1